MAGDALLAVAAALLLIATTRLTWSAFAKPPYGEQSSTRRRIDGVAFMVLVICLGFFAWLFWAMMNANWT